MNISEDERFWNRFKRKKINKYCIFTKIFRAIHKWDKR